MAKKRLLGAIIASCALATALVGCSAAQSSVTVSGRTLLMYHATSASADALGHGTLGVNDKGCVTIGENVLVVPDGSRLHTDGSLTIHAKTYRLGSSLQLGGGGGDPPANSPCGSDTDYFWAG